MTRKSFTLPQSPDISSQTSEQRRRSVRSVIKAPEKGLRLYISCRWKISFCCMFGMLSLFSQRHCISMAVVCMTNIASVNYGANFSDAWNVSKNESQNMESSTMIEKEWLGIVFSAYYYGYIITPLVGGLIAIKLGPKLVIFIAMLLFTICNLCMPIGIKSGIYIVIVLRILMGLSSGVVLPSIQVLWSNWAPLHEKARLIAVSRSGVNLGNILAVGIAGFFCEIPLDGGWPFIFYTFGMGGMVWMICWCYFVYDSPAVHPSISIAEQAYIEYGKSKMHPKKILKVPWCQILTSLPFWSIIVSNVCQSWIFTLQSNFLPIYMNDVMKFDVVNNGLLSSIPFTLQFIMSLVFATAVDKIISHGLMSVTVARKTLQILGMILPSIIYFGMGYIDSELRYLAVALLSLAMGLQASTDSSFTVNHLDIAPRFAGPIIGLSVTCACAAAISVPLITSALTPQGTREEWKMVFFISGGISTFGALFFAIFSSGVEQPWAIDETIEFNITTPSQDSTKDISKTECYENPVYIHS